MSIAFVTALVALVAVQGQRVARAAPPAADHFVPLSPTPLLDSRNGTGTAAAGRIAANAAVTFQVAGRAGIPASGVSAVALNVIAINPAAFGWLTVYPSDVPTTTSTLTYSAGETVVVEDFTRLTSTGAITIKNNGSGDVHLAVSADGYFLAASGTAAGNEYYPVSTEYLYDTRPAHSTGSPARTTPIPANSTVTFAVTGQKSIPASGVSAVALNVVAAHQTVAKGWLSLYPSDKPDPMVSSVDYNPNEGSSSLEVVPLTGTGQLKLTNHGAAEVHVSITTRGYFLGAAAGDGSTYKPAATQILLQTLDGTGVEGGGTQPLAAGATIAFDATRLAGVRPDEVTAAGININARQPTAQGWLSVYAADAEDPSISSVTFDSGGESTHGFDLAIPDATGKLKITNHSSGTVHLQVSTRGYYIELDDPDSSPETVEAISAEDAEVYTAEDGASVAATFRDITKSASCTYGWARITYRKYSTGSVKLRWVEGHVYQVTGWNGGQFDTWRGHGGATTYWFADTYLDDATWNDNQIPDRYPSVSNAKPYVKFQAGITKAFVTYKCKVYIRMT
ncbi:hypothetical protein [Phytohabitans houttuyneae]|uniref:hypothetical protein n=1 Tax=Phytohabitans houttuyneae TaxID=1076126 RepID=UPI0015658EED|nr:hypothetical protein [Phytohabitans houttuyneae]